MNDNTLGIFVSHYFNGFR